MAILAGLFIVGPAATPVMAAATEPSMRLLDVPFVPQEKGLCGGAALSMVLRFWGASGVRAKDFADLLTPDGQGIRADDLERVANRDDWRALRLRPAMESLVDCLARGQPIVALLSESADTNHYVVVVGITADRVCLHDPRRGPFRFVARLEFERAWREAEAWALLVLPYGSSRVPPSGGLEPASSDRPSTPTSCDSLVDAGIAVAISGDLERAERLLWAARDSCPLSAAPLCELAGIRFRQQRWPEAESLSQQATRLDPTNAHAWQLLATTRYVRGAKESALTAWNVVQAPHIDLTRIDGLGRTRYDVVTQLLGLRQGSLLSEATLKRARRRLETLPTRTGGRLSYTPLAEGTARVDVNVGEKRTWGFGASTLPLAAAHAVIDREARLEVASPLGLGELWTARWRWWENRPLLAATVALPSAPGIWTMQGAWERQAVRRAGFQQSFERRWASIDCSQWASADVRWLGGAAFSRWEGGGFDASLRGALEARPMQDRAILRAEASQAWSVSGGAPYATASLLTAWRSGTRAARPRVEILARAGLAAASAHAPMVLWPAAGSESSCAVRLRAHPLFDQGVMAGEGWGQELAHGGFEVQVWPIRQGLASIGVATFVDVAKPWSPGEASDPPLQTDVGAGLRLRLASHHESLRIDFARGTRDGASALSVGLASDRSWMD